MTSNFTEQDYVISNNASAGNYQQAKIIVVTIIGKNQLQDTIELQIYIRCHNQSANEKIFKNSNFNVNNLNPITLYPNDYQQVLRIQLLLKMVLIHLLHYCLRQQLKI